MEEMDPRIIEALKSRDPEERKKAVRALAQTHTTESLRYLATIFKKDPDASVRELAIKAGRHIKKTRAATDWVGEGDVRFSTNEIPAVSRVSNVAQEQAKGLMDKALDESVKSNYEKAEEYVRQAFKLNPDLQFDTYYLGIASDVMGMNEDEVLAVLLNPPAE